MPLSEKLLLPSVLSLIFANLILLFGVVFFDWNIRDVFYVYFFETIIIGFYSVLHLWQAPPSKLRQITGVTIERLVHIVIFCFIYGVVVAVMGVYLSLIFPLYEADLTRIAPSVVVLFLSHGVSYYVNFLGNREFESQSLIKIFTQPFKRLMFPHLLLVLILSLFGTTLPIVMFIIFRTCIDLNMHIWEHEFFWQHMGEGSFSGDMSRFRG